MALTPAPTPTLTQQYGDTARDEARRKNETECVALLDEWQVDTAALLAFERGTRDPQCTLRLLNNQDVLHKIASFVRGTE